MNVQKTLKVYQYNSTKKKSVMCVPKGNPLLMHPLEVEKIYLLNKKNMYAICKEHQEIILVE